MAFTLKVRGAIGGTIRAEYRCPVHGVFEAEVERNEKGEAPDEVLCPVLETAWFRQGTPGPVPVNSCNRPSPWTLTSAPGMAIARASFSRGKSDGPRKATDMDTRALGEGQSLREWKAERAKVWRDEDYRATKVFLRGGGG